MNAVNIIDLLLPFIIFILGYLVNRTFLNKRVIVTQDWINEQCTILISAAVIEELIYRDWWKLKFGDEEWSYYSSMLIFALTHVYHISGIMKYYETSGLIVVITTRLLTAIHLSYLTWNMSLIEGIVYHIIYNYVQFIIQAKIMIKNSDSIR
jgi:hypothetical protein